MAILGIVTDKDIVAKEYFKNIIHRSKSDSLLKNPFEITAKLKEGSKDYFFLMDLKPVYPPVSWFGFLLLIPYIVFKWFNIFLIFPFVLIGLGFFWSSSFYLSVLYVAIKKSGYKGKIKILSNKKIIERLIHGTDRNL